ncbi:hypothetical protein OLMES_3836 [Oleiphilus messinensis]|uniref:DUF6316 domain-containing protein n=1 Tax=Oleiphilus messinensis TaxID=141451 RepID=A0A1Y0IDJ5_9GAMM|nr:DUF6316 family protein [Oleiphilus messinensis]ARU57856.1 hypothetical protein OLMES_3836 [Oleiphilus messinensis]
MQAQRWEDTGKRFHPKTDRFVYSDQKWYFITREDGCMGPYESKEAAEDGLCSFLMELLEKNKICPI